MYRYLFLAAALSCSSSAVAGDGAWTTNMFNGWVVSDFADGERSIALFCKGVGEREFVYTLSEASVGPTLAARDTMDMMMVVKGRDDKESKKVATAKTERTAGMLSYRITGQEAWSFMSGVAYSKVITVGLWTKGTLSEGIPELVFKLNTYNGQTEDAAYAVLGACSEPEPEPSPVKPQ